MTDTPRRRRKLAAILMLDVVGFSRMMGADEEGTTAAIVAFHEQVRGVVERHGGRVVGTAGDSVFGDFESIVEALDCAAEIQRGLHSENAGRAPEDRIDARIGLHLGDVIVEERNVFGDGVNVAARLEQLAEPGGIMLSEAVYQVVRGRTDLPMEGLGVRELKNIEEPIGVYRIGAAAFGGTPPPAPAVREAQPPARSAAQDDRRERMREAIGRIVEKAAEKAAEKAEEAEPVVIDARGTASEEIVAPFRAGSLVLGTIGVFGILARTTGWTENAWYPFLGSWLLGLTVGGIVDRLTGSRGMRLLFLAAGIGIGALFFDNVVTRAILWVITAGVVGAALGALGRARQGRPTR